MAHFRDLFMYLALGSDPADRVVDSNALSELSIVPVPDVETAARVAASMGADLIELYGGLGQQAAAAVLAATGDGAVPVGLVGADYPTPPANLVIVYESPGADPAVDRHVHTHANGTVTVVAVPDPAAVPAVASELVTAGADRVELCGGMGPVPAAATQAAVGDRAPVSTVLFGFESLPAAVAYRTRYEQTLATHPELAP